MFTRVDGTIKFLGSTSIRLFSLSHFYSLCLSTICVHMILVITRDYRCGIWYTTLDMKFIEDYKMFRDVHKTPNIPPDMVLYLKGSYYTIGDWREQ